MGCRTGDLCRSARRGGVWIVLFALVVLLTLDARYRAYLPGDVKITLFVQTLSPVSTNWAQWISSTAKFPWSLILLAVTVGFSWKLAGWRAALLAIASFLGMWALGKWLGPFVGRPRPSPDLVRVAEQLSGSSFPSIFALVYASTIGFLASLFAQKASGTLRVCVVVICCAFFVVGFAARISLGAHWPSDVLLSYLIGLLWAGLLIRFV
jgi:membrane-associated phospholipid phosphatase